jgi:hypothetical protein
VAEHSYRPPDQFIEAVLKGPTPDSREYREFLAKLGYRMGTPIREIEFGSLKKTGQKD